MCSTIALMERARGDVDAGELVHDPVGRIVVGEEGPELRRDEPPDTLPVVLVLEDDPDRVAAVPVAGLAEDRLGAVVVLRGVVDEPRAVVVVGRGVALTVQPVRARATSVTSVCV
jgi:hypothetical protein